MATPLGAVGTSCRSRPVAPRRGTSWQQLIERLQGADEDAYLSICRAARVAPITTCGSRLSRKLEGLRGSRCCRRRPAVAVGGNRSAEVSWASPRSRSSSGMGPQWWAMGYGSRRSPSSPRRSSTATRSSSPSRAGRCARAQRDEADSRMDKADVAQVTNVAIQIALADGRAGGITPTPSSGTASARSRPHMSPEPDARVVLAYHKPTQAQTAGQGKMLAAGITEAEAETLLGDLDGTVSLLAAVNAPSSVTLSGDRCPPSAARLPRGRGTLRALAPGRRALPQPEDGPAAGRAAPSLEPMRPRCRGPLCLDRDRNVACGHRPGSRWWQNVRHPVRFGAARLTG